MNLPEFMEDRLLNRKDKGNMYGTGISDKEFILFIMDYLLGEDFFVSDPIGGDQINEVALKLILKKYSKRYRKDVKAAAKKKITLHYMVDGKEVSHEFDEFKDAYFFTEDLDPGTKITIERH